jgi:hypothetical protein
MELVKTKIVRKWRKKSPIGVHGDWEYEIGEAPLPRVTTDTLIAQSSSNPHLYRKDSPSHFIWRVRNAVWPKEVYQLSLDLKDRKIVIRTTNKKYYKRLEIPDMDRLQLPLEESALNFDWGSNTLVVKYKKPKAVLDKEKVEQKERLFTKEKRSAPRDGDVECKQS